MTLSYLRVLFFYKKSYLAVCFVLICWSQIAALCSCPDCSSKVDFLKRAPEAVEFTDWLVQLEPPFAPQNTRIPLMAVSSLPLTTVENDVMIEGSFEVKQSVVCSGTMCNGSVRGSGVHSSTLSSYGLSGTWSTDNKLIEATATLQYENGLEARWSLSEETLRATWLSSIDSTVDRLNYEFRGTVTGGQKWIEPQYCEYESYNGSLLANCDENTYATYSKPDTTVAWATALTSTTFVGSNFKQIFEYGDSVTGWYRSNFETRILSLGSTYLGATSELQDCKPSDCTSTKSFPEGEAYFEISDHMSAAGSSLSTLTDSTTLYLQRTITTYNGLERKINGELTLNSPTKKSLFAQVYFEGLSQEGIEQNYIATGHFVFREHPSRMHASWEGVLQEADGSVLAIRLDRDLRGFWHFSASYDFYTSKPLPDEEYSFRFMPDGSGKGVAFVLSGEDEDATRFEIPFAFPQVGARLSER